MDRLNKILARLKEEAFTPNAEQKKIADNLVKAFEKNISSGHGGKVTTKAELRKAVYEFMDTNDIPTNRMPPWAIYIRDRLLKSKAEYWPESYKRDFQQRTDPNLTDAFNRRR